MEKKGRILLSILLTVLLVGCIALLIGVGSFFNNLFDVLLLSAPGPCEGRVPEIKKDSYRLVVYEWMLDGSAIVIMNNMGSAQLGTRFDLVNVDEGTVENLITYPPPYPRPSVDNFMLSPSGQYIAVPEIKYLNSDFYPNLAIYETDEREQTPESHLLMKIDHAYAGLWFPDEKQIALAVVPDPVHPHPQAIHIAQFAPTITQVITLTSSEYRYTSWNPLVGWSADGHKLITDMGGANGLRLIDIESGMVQVLNESKTCFSDITLSPTEDKLALSSHEEYAIDEGESGWDIIIKDIPEDTNEIVTDFIDEDEIQPTWSPDGTRLAFLRAFTDETGQAQQEIMIMDLASNSMTNLTDAAELSPFSPKWSPRGDKIAFLTYEGGDYHLNVMVIETKELLDLYSTADH